jgi:flagellar motility protein MotE (MotC chaperone)
MRIHIPTPRLLPWTIALLVAVLLRHGVALLMLVFHQPGYTPSPLVVAEARAAAPQPDTTRPGDGKPEAGRPDPGKSQAGKGPAGTAADQAAAGVAPLATLNAPPPVSDSERALLQDLRARRAELEARAATQATREAALAATETRINGRIAELGKLQAQLEAMDTARKERENAGLQSLVKMYETMRPRDAATIFNDLDQPVLLMVLDRMKEAKAAPILAAMQPERARQATTQLVELRSRRDGAPGGS